MSASASMTRLLYRLGPEGIYAATDPEHSNERPLVRVLHSDPFTAAPASWRLERAVDPDSQELLAPVAPGKILGIGRNYHEHAREMGNPVPAEPLLFLKAPSSLIGPRAAVVLPPESARVEHEGEIALVLRARLRRASPEEARQAILGVTCACDVTARDLQRKDATFARAKSFDTFCPLGPAIWVEPDLDELAVMTRVNGEERQRASAREMIFSFVELLVYASRMMTLEPGDVILTGTPGGVGPLAAGDRVEVEIPGLGVLANPVETLRGA
jgi:2-keto-4-pentenoate hydratase/2-oxohepta-3-ene-1,7-dioic acid hydratase in catechol pathway